MPKVPDHLRKRRPRGTGKVAKSCQYCGISFMASIHNPGKYCSRSCNKRSKPTWNQGMKGYTNPGSFKKGHAQTNSGRTHITSERVSKEKNINWKGGITPEIKLIRRSKEYKLWREAVFSRDNWSCVWCSAKSSSGNAVYLHADHIKPFAFYPEIRFAIDNGRTLCKPCHMKTDTWGKKAYKYKIQ